MRLLVPLLQRVPLLLTLSIGGYLIAASDFIDGYMIMALTAFGWWAMEHLNVRAIAVRLAGVAVQLRAMPSVLTVVIAIGFAAASIALYLDQQLGF